MDDYRGKLEIDKTNLDEEMAKQASQYLFVAELSVQADMAYEKMKNMAGELEATLDAKIRAKNAGGKITEAAIRAEIERSEEYQKTQRALIELRGRREVAKALRESWYMRKDLLIQLAIKQRAELESLGVVVKHAA